MAGAANLERQEAYVNEVTVGTTPATPSFIKTSFDVLSLSADPRISESRPASAQGQRGGIGRNGNAVTGNANGKLIYGEYDDFFASLFQADWSSDVLINGQGQNTMTVEQAIPQGAGGALAYTRYLGVEATTGSLGLTAGQDATVAFDLIGAGSEDATPTAITGATYADPTETDIIGSGADIGTILMSGLTPLDCMESCSVDFGVADKTDQPRLSSDDPCGVNRGVMLPTVTGRFYVEDNFVAVYNAARAGTEFALTIPIGSVTLKKYELYFPKCEFSRAPLVTGETGPAFQEFTILPKYDSGIGGTCRLTRAIA